MDYTYTDIAKMIDHALLNPTATTAQLDAGCRLAAAYDVASVCILPYYVSRCAELLEGSTVLTSTTIGFPNGGHATSTKVTEARSALADGCAELDMVVNLSKVLSGDDDYVRAEIRAVLEVVRDGGCRLKVIFENCCLQDVHKVRLCEICQELGVDWVKTSTGFGTGGATMDDLRLMTKHTSPPVQVKASGGVRDLQALLAIRELGVTRIGASATAAILDPCREQCGLPPINPGSEGPSGY